MKANKAILCGVVLAAISLATAPCGAQDKTVDKECISLIGEYYAAVNKQDIKRVLTVTAGRAVVEAASNAAYAKVYAKTVPPPAKTKLIRTSGALTLYEVVTTAKRANGTKADYIVMILKMVEGRRKIVDVLYPKEWKLGIEHADYENIHRPALDEATWYYQHSLAEAKYRKKVLDHAAKPLPENNCLRKAYYSKIPSLDPAACGDTASADIQAHVFEGLYAYHYLKRPVEVIPLLADGMPKVSKDGLIWTIKIKKGVKYSRNPCFGLDDKGKPRTRTVTAGDFVLAFKRIADFHVRAGLAMALAGRKIAGANEYRKKTRNYAVGDFSRYDKEKLTGVVAVDDLTLQITLKQITPQFLHFLTMTQYAPVPREAVEYYLATQEDASGRRKPLPIKQRQPEIRHTEAMVGTGPYIITKHIPGEVFIFTRNPDFREQFYPSQGSAGDQAAGLLADAGKRLPFIDRIEMEYTPGYELSWMAFAYGQLDRDVIPPGRFSEVVATGWKLTKEYAFRGVRLAKLQLPAIYWIALNMEDPVLGKSKSLRQAMSLCIDAESYIKTIFQGRGKPAINCLPSSISGCSEAGASPYARFDLAAARKKLIAAKKELAAAGLLKNGRIPTLTLELGSRDAASEKIAKFMQKQFAAIDLKVDVKMNTWVELLKKTNEGKAQMITLGWHGDYPDPENFLHLYYSPNIAETTNTTRYSNPIYDDLFRKFTALPYGPARDKLCKKLVNMISEDCPVLLLNEPVSVFVHQKWLGNVKPHPFASGTARYHRIDAKARAAAPIGLNRKPLP